jgi:glycosyltransferase involved in cell wall biosynthesis
MMFSVVIPVGNKAPHLNRSINSVLNQSFAHFELLLIDDATTDGSAEKLSEFNDSRIRILRRDVPGPGGYAARNLGIKEAKCKWVAFLDADDEWDSKYLETMAQAIKENSEIKVFASAYYYTDGKSKNLNRYHSINHTRGNHQFDFSMFLLYKPMWTGTVIIDRETLLKHGAFPEGRTSSGGDEFLWFHIMESERKGFWVNFPGAQYHRDSVNMVTRINEKDLRTNILFPAINELIRRETDPVIIQNLKKYWNFKAWYYFKNISKRRVMNFTDLRYYFWEPRAMNAKIFIPVLYSIRHTFSK